MIPFLKVVHYNPSGSEKDLSPYVLTVQVNIGKEATKNTLNIELQNHNGELNNQDFEVANSSIVIYLDWQPIVIGTTLPLISASLSSIAFPTDNSGKYKLKIKATDKTAMLLSKMWAQAYGETENLNAPEIITNLIGHLNDLDGDTGNGVQLGKTPLTTNHVATTKWQGGSFPRPVSMSKIWKPGYEWLNDLSQPENTGEDRPYIYYIDESNDLHWHYPYQKPITTLTSSINSLVTTIPVTNTSGYPTAGTFVIEDEAITYTGLTSNSFTGCTRGANFTNAISHNSGTEVSALFLWLGKQDIYSLNIDTTEDSTYNFIIYNGGPTPQGFEYLDYSLDYTQVGKRFRMKFFDWKSVAKDITNAEKNRSGWLDKEDSFPTGAYPWQPWWLSTTVANDEEYQEAFELKVREMCETKCKAYYVTGKQKYKAECQIRGTTAYQIGDLVNVVSPKFGFSPTGTPMILRVDEIKHQVNKGSWVTDISLTQDSEALITT